MGLEAPWDDDDFETSAEEVGALLRAQAEAEDDTEEEGDFSFSSLSCFRPRTTKKKPVLVVDEEELAKEHEQLMAGTAQLMEEEEEHPRAASSFLGLNPMGEDGLLEEDGGEEEEGDLPGFSDPDALLRPEEDPEPSSKPAKKKMALDPLEPEELAEAQAALDAAAREQETEAAEGGHSSDDWRNVEEAVDSEPLSEFDDETPAAADLQDEPEGATDTSWFDREQDDFVPPPLIDSDLPSPEIPGKDELAEIAARLFGPARQTEVAEEAEPSPVPPPAVEMTPEPQTEPEPDIFAAAKPELAQAPEPELEPEAEPAPEESSAEAEPIAAVEPEPMPEPVAPGFTAFEDEDDLPQPEESASETVVEESSAEPVAHDEASRAHVMREYDYEEEAAATEPDYDYAPAVTQQSSLRARLIKPEHVVEETRGESLLGRFWNWLKGLFG